MLDFLAFEEPQATVDAISDARTKQRMLQHPRLRVRTIQQRHVGQSCAAAIERLHFVDDELRFIVV